MPSQRCEAAIACALNNGKALLKFISPNDVGLTGGHQKGFYLPKQVREPFTPFAPIKGVNEDHAVEVTWYDNRVTHSTVKWYGRGTRSEYRLTGFNRERNCPYIAAERVGSLLVLVPERIDRFHGFILEDDEDVDDIQAGLGIEIHDKWMFFDASQTQLPLESEEDCLDRRFNAFAQVLIAFPPTVEVAQEARDAVLFCARSFLTCQSDDQLKALIDAEYRLFKAVERKVCGPLVSKLFASIDEFLAIAQSILQRRKARAGRSLEHHVEYLLGLASLPFETQVDVDGTKPDILIPSKKAYLDPSWPVDRLFVLGLKTTCKDRWRQVTQEAPRISQKHILTLQNGISAPQMEQMRISHVTLVVPKSLHEMYPPESRNQVLRVDQFIGHVKSKLASDLK